MTQYVLRDDLSYCRIGKKLVFLDIAGDRYFHLPYPMEQSFIAYLEGNAPASDINNLIERAILVKKVGPSVISRPSIKPAARSATELALQPTNFSAFEMAEVLATVLMTWVVLKASSLKRILDGIRTERQILARKNMPETQVEEQRLLSAADVFRSARLYVPIEMRCLLDSIAMARFLLRRGIQPHIVFGIALDPFSAHCWVQVDDIVLNDSLGNVAAHTPIRVV